MLEGGYVLFEVECGDTCYTMEEIPDIFGDNVPTQLPKPGTAINFFDPGNPGYVKGLWELTAISNLKFEIPKACRLGKYGKAFGRKVVASLVAKLKQQ